MAREKKGTWLIHFEWKLKTLLQGNPARSIFVPTMISYHAVMAVTNGIGKGYTQATL